MLHSRFFMVYVPPPNSFCLSTFSGLILTDASAARLGLLSHTTVGIRSGTLRMHRQEPGRNEPTRMHQPSGTDLRPAIRTELNKGPPPINSFKSETTTMHHQKCTDLLRYCNGQGAGREAGLQVAESMYSIPTVHAQP